MKLGAGDSPLELEKRPSERGALRAPDKVLPLRKAELAVNVTNLFEEKGASTVSIGTATNSYSAYPIPPRQWFLTLSAAY